MLSLSYATVALGSSSIAAVGAQRYANLYSDLLLKWAAVPTIPITHRGAWRMGSRRVMHGATNFAPHRCGGAGQRLFFLHDGRARDLSSAILAHKGPSSEANAVVKLYEKLPTTSKQDLIDFLRSR